MPSPVFYQRSDFKTYPHLIYLVETNAVETQSKVCVTAEVVVYARHPAKIIGRGRRQFCPCHRRPTGLQGIRSPTGRRLLDVLGSSLPSCVFLFVLLAAVLSLALSKLPPAFAVAEKEKGRGDQRLVWTQAVPNGYQPFEPPSETQSNRRPFAMQTLATLLRRSFKRKYFISQNNKH